MGTGYLNIPPASGGGYTPPTVATFWSQWPTNPYDYFIQEFDIFPNLIAGGVGNMISAASGTSAAFNLVDKSAVNAGINSTEKAIGVGYLNAGTAATGRCFLGFGTNNVASIQIGQQEIRWGIRANLDALSDGTTTYTAYHGFMDTITAAPAHGAFFRYTHGTNSGKWEFCAAAGSGIVAADTGVAPTATVYQLLEIVINTAGTSITYYIDGTLVGTVTTGIPTNGTFPGSSIIKSLGASGRGIYVDALYLAIERLAVR